MFKDSIYNYKNAQHIIEECCCCKSKEVLYDSRHDLVFCRICGAVLKENVEIQKTNEVI